jgi:formylmethanofuran dehydrogenase subunit D
VTLAPLYPQFADSTTTTVIEEVKRVVRERGLNMRLSTLPPFYDQPEYLDALVASAKPYLQQDFDHLLLSFHGLPERHLHKLDPSGHCLKGEDCCRSASPAVLANCYRAQCLRSAELFAQRMGLHWAYAGEHDGVAAVYEEMRQAMVPAIGGIDWARLNAGSVTYPCVSADDPGQPIVFHDHFPTPDGRVQLVPAALIPAAEQPDAEYPLVLITGRQLEHWHTGSMTRRATVLDALEPAATASMHGSELQRLGLRAGDVVVIASRRGRLHLQLRQDDGMPTGTVFMPFAYQEAAANLLTHAALDPFGKIPEFKYCAVRIETGPLAQA